MFEFSRFYSLRAAFPLGLGCGIGVLIAFSHPNPKGNASRRE